jgi:hypothetical protein
VIPADYLLLADLQIGKEWILKKMGKRAVIEGRSGVRAGFEFDLGVGQ